jgi:hypothetical protein
MFSTKSEVFSQTMTDGQNCRNPKKNETQLHCNSLCSGDITDEWIRLFDSYSGAQTNQTLPPFGETFENTYSNSPKEQENPASHAKVEEFCNDEKKSKRLPTILPGVIRHTSHPERSLAYYYSDRG